MEEKANGGRGIATGMMIMLFSSLVSAGFFILFTFFAYKKNITPTNAQQVILQITAMFCTIFMTQFIMRQIQGNKLNFFQGLLGGWMANLLLAMFISFYFTIFASKIGAANIPKGAFGALLFLYSGFGIAISGILALILQKK